jgi:hypothetical protein
MTTQKEFIQKRQQDALLERLERRIGGGGHGAGDACVRERRAWGMRTTAGYEGVCNGGFMYGKVHTNEVSSHLGTLPVVSPPCHSPARPGVGQAAVRPVSASAAGVPTSAGASEAATASLGAVALAAAGGLRIKKLVGDFVASAGGALAVRRNTTSAGIASAPGTNTGTTGDASLGASDGREGPAGAHTAGEQPAGLTAWRGARVASAPSGRPQVGEGQGALRQCLAMQMSFTCAPEAPLGPIRCERAPSDSS